MGTTTITRILISDEEFAQRRRAIVSLLAPGVRERVCAGCSAQAASERGEHGAPSDEPARPAGRIAPYDRYVDVLQRGPHVRNVGGASEAGPSGPTRTLEEAAVGGL